MFARNIVMPKSPLLTLEEAADRLRTSTWTVRRWIREGKLVGTRIGNQLRVDSDDLEEFIRKGKTIQKNDSQDA